MALVESGLDQLSSDTTQETCRIQSPPSELIITLLLLLSSSKLLQPLTSKDSKCATRTAGQLEAITTLCINTQAPKYTLYTFHQHTITRKTIENNQHINALSRVHHQHKMMQSRTLNIYANAKTIELGHKANIMFWLRFFPPAVGESDLDRWTKTVPWSASKGNLVAESQHCWSNASTAIATAMAALEDYSTSASSILQWTRFK